MPQAVILQEDMMVDETGESFHVLIEVINDEDNPVLQVMVKITNMKTDFVLTEFHVGFEVTNPLDPVSVGIQAGTAYGLCITWKLLKLTYDTTKDGYDRSKKEKPDSAARERLHDIYGHLSGAGEEYRTTTRAALKECLGPAGLRAAFGIFM